MTDAQAIVIGGGHNGLVAAAYLARAGIDTLLLEARSSVGGCASTEVEFGARFNICNCDHTLIRAMPIIDELDLGRYGLDYLEPSPTFAHLFWDDATPWLLHHDVEQTIDGIARHRPESVDGYRRYITAARPAAELTIELAKLPPSAPKLVAETLKRRGRGAARLVRWSRLSALDVLRQFFDDEHLILPLVSTGPTVWGVPPETPGTGMAALGYAIRHVVRVGRPVGGSGALTDALAAAFAAAGGRIRCGASVDRLLVEDQRVIGVALAGGEVLRADTVVAACDPHRVFVEWLDEVPARARKLVRHWRDQPAPDGYESKVDAVVSALPRYRALDRIADQLTGTDPLEPTAVISPTLEQLAEAHALRRSGQVHAQPTLLVNFPSALDPTMRVEGGGHVLSLEALFTPYALAGGWPGSGEPDRWLRQWATLVEPDYLDHLVARRAMTPDRYEREFRMHRGHTPAYAGSPLATLLGRRRELSRYRTPVGGLYLSGAGTYPGAGIFGASGRNAAAVVLGALGVRRS